MSSFHSELARGALLALFGCVACTRPPPREQEVRFNPTIRCDPDGGAPIRVHSVVVELFRVDDDVSERGCGLCVAGPESCVLLRRECLCGEAAEGLTGPDLERALSGLRFEDVGPGPKCVRVLALEDPTCSCVVDAATLRGCGLTGTAESVAIGVTREAFVCQDRVCLLPWCAGLDPPAWCPPI